MEKWYLLLFLLCPLMHLLMMRGHKHGGHPNGEVKETVTEKQSHFKGS